FALAAPVRMRSPNDIVRPHLAASDRGMDIVHRGARKPLQRRLYPLLRQRFFGPRKVALDHAATEPGILIADRRARRAADRRARLARDHDRFPRRRRRMALPTDDLDLVAG